MVGRLHNINFVNFTNTEIPIYMRALYNIIMSAQPQTYRYSNKRLFVQDLRIRLVYKNNHKILRPPPPVSYHGIRADTLLLYIYTLCPTETSFPCNTSRDTDRDRIKPVYLNCTSPRAVSLRKLPFLKYYNNDDNNNCSFRV